MDNRERKSGLQTHEDASGKIRSTFRPPLSKNLISLMIDFLIQEDRRPIPRDTPVWTHYWLEQLTECTELKHYTKGLSIKQRFLNWLNLLDVFVTEDGIHQLCLANSHKIVPCKEELGRIVRDAHRSTGEFEILSTERQPGSQVKHNSIKRCIRMIRAKYAFGIKEFGFHSTAVYREVLRCPECHREGKVKVVGGNVVEVAEMVDPDYGNEMNFTVLEDATMCMVLKGPSQNSVWYNQSDLATEQCIFKKLLGVIEEIGIEVGKTSEGSKVCMERLVTKICCAEKLIHDLKRGAEKEFAFRIPSTHFFQDFDKFAKEFVAMSDTAVYLQDMNYLLNTYRRFRNSEFIEQVNTTLKELENGKNSTLNLVLQGREVYLEGSLQDSIKGGHEEVEMGQKELEVEQKELEEEQKELEMEQEELEVEQKELEVEQKELEVEQEEVEVEQKEVEVEQKEVEVEQKGLEVEQKGLEVEQKELEVEQKELEVERKELDVELKEVEMEQKKLEVELKELEVEQKELQVEHNKLQVEQKESQIEKELQGEKELKLEEKSAALSNEIYVIVD